jgi:serine/threonine protein kinase
VIDGQRLQPGHRVAQRFQVVAYLGAGEMGEVYDVRDVSTGYAYALKLLAPEFLSRADAMAALRQEAERASQLGAAAVAKSYEFEVEPAANAPYVLGEYVAIPSLSARVGTDGPISIPTLDAILRALAPALDQAHAAGLVHRALKPSNIFAAHDVEQSGNVRVTDFGIASARMLAPPPPGWTATPGWLSAEQADPATPASPTMDVYALGLVAFFALTGVSPFMACRTSPPDLNMLWAEMTAPLPPASQRARELGVLLSPTLDPWFARALAVVPTQRFRSVGEMSQALFALVGSSQHVATMRPPPVAPNVPAPQMTPAPPQAEAQHDASMQQPSPPPMQAPAAGMPAADAPQPSTQQSAAQAEPVADLDEPVPKKSSGVVVPVVIGGGLALIAVVAVGGWFAWSRIGAPKPATTASATAANTAPASAPTATVSAPATAVTASAAPPTSADADAGAPEEPKDALVKFECDPGCDEIKCDDAVVEDPSAGVRLPAGKHRCTAKKEGYVSRTQTFSVKAGEETTRKFDLPKQVRGGGGGPAPAKTCGTFLNPCK